MRVYFRFPLLFLLPSLAGFLAFNLGPILTSLLLSFVDYDGLRPLTLRTIQENWVGLENYRRLLEDPVFHRAFWNTLFYVGVAVPLEMVLALLLALGLNRPWWGVKVLRTLYLLPTVTSVVAVGLLWRWVLNPTVGPVNLFLRFVGEKLAALWRLLGAEPPAFLAWLAREGPGWLSDPHWAIWGVILASVWAGVGLRMLIFLAGLQNISREYLEAASWMGPTAPALLLRGPPPAFPHGLPEHPPRHDRGLPGLRPGLHHDRRGSLGQHQRPHALPLPEAFGTFPFEMGYASAIAWVLFLILFALTYLQWALRRRWVLEEA